VQAQSLRKSSRSKQSSSAAERSHFGIQRHLLSSHPKHVPKEKMTKEENGHDLYLVMSIFTVHWHSMTDAIQIHALFSSELVVATKMDSTAGGDGGTKGYVSMAQYFLFWECLKRSFS
jgi:hypothetical protein